MRLLVGVRHHLFKAGIALAIVLALLPLVVALASGISHEAAILCALNGVAWLTVALLFQRHSEIFKTVEEAVTTLGLPDVAGDLTDMISRFSTESMRYHRAAFGFRSSVHTGQGNLSQNLSRIVELAYSELDAKAVELSLFDEESGLWSQAMIVGFPSTTESQSMLAVDADSGKSKVVEEKAVGRVVAKPVTFAGTLFGALRVELREGRELTTSDRHVLHLLATQGGILLVDARFGEEALRLRRLSEETTRAKTGFLANLSHELRGPLGIILNAVELSMEGLCGPVSEPLLEMLRMIKDSSDHLLDLVNDVLDYAKVEAGKVIATPVELPVKPLLEDLCAVVRSQAISKGHKLILEEVDPTLGIFCDRRHARQILINFLTNAIKYTPDGGTVTVSAMRVAGKRAKLLVQDTGIGIPEDQRDKVFGAFERVDHKYAMAQTGTGLGMPLTRKLVEVNAGTIGFDSKDGEGSSFWAIIPAVEVKPDHIDDSDTDDGPVRPQGHGETILLIDHDTDSRKMVERYLVEQGFAIVNAQTGIEVMKVLRERSIELAVVENDLPDLPGEEMISAIRNTPNAATVPIILLSSKAFVFDIERFLKLGVDRCLSKPVALNELARTVRRLIDETRSLENNHTSPN